MNGDHFANEDAPFINMMQTSALAKPIRGLLEILDDNAVIDIHLISTLDCKEKPNIYPDKEAITWKTYNTTAHVFRENIAVPGLIPFGQQYTFMPSLLAQIVDKIIPDQTLVKLRYHLANLEHQMTWEPRYGHVIFETPIRTYLHLGRVSNAMGATIASEISTHNLQFVDSDSRYLSNASG